MALKVGYFSDLHTEFLRPAILLTPKDRRLGRIYSLEDFAEELAEAYKEVDVIVAAGDIGNGDAAVGFLRTAFPEKPVIFTPGNHDFWGGEIHSVNKKIAAACQGTNIHYLPGGETVEIEGVRFVGATLWTDYLLGNKNADSAKFAMTRVEDLMNDFRRIRIDLRGTGKGGQYARLHAHHLLGFHQSHLSRIKDEMARALAEDVLLIVVTHHTPSAQSLVFDSGRANGQSWEAAFQPYDVCYCSHLDYLMMGEDAPQYWIHGHTHVSVDYRIGNTRVVSNSKGYAEGDDTCWVAGRYIEVPN